MTDEQIDDIRGHHDWLPGEMPERTQARKDTDTLIDEVYRLRKYRRMVSRVRHLAGDLDECGKHKQARAIFDALNAEERGSQPAHVAPALARWGLK